MAPVSPTQGNPLWNRMNFVLGLPSIRLSSSRGLDPCIRALPVCIWMGNSCWALSSATRHIIKSSKSLSCCSVKALRGRPKASNDCFLETFAKRRSRLYAMPVFKQRHLAVWHLQKSGQPPQGIHRTCKGTDYRGGHTHRGSPADAPARSSESRAAANLHEEHGLQKASKF